MRIEIIDSATTPLTVPAIIGAFGTPDEADELDVGLEAELEVCVCASVCVYVGVEDVIAISTMIDVGGAVVVASVEDRTEFGIDIRVCLVVGTVVLFDAGVVVELESVSGQAGNAQGSTEQHPLKLLI